MTGPDQNSTICEGAFTVYLEKFPRMTAYTEAVTPYLSERPEGIPIFVDSTVVLMMAWHEDFLKSLIAEGILHKEAEARAYFVKFGHGDERTRAIICRLPELIAMGRSRVKFKNRGASLEKLFAHLFGFSLWPTDQTRDRVLDLNVLRQLIVHHGGASLGDDYWDQLSDKSVVKTTRYGELPPIRRIDYYQCVMVFLKNAFEALGLQATYLRNEMLSRSEWTYTPKRSDTSRL